MTVTDMEIYESQRQSLEHLGLLSCSTVYYEQLCGSFIVAVESIYEDRSPRDKEKEENKDGQEQC